MKSSTPCCTKCRRRAGVLKAGRAGWFFCYLCGNHWFAQLFANLEGGAR